MFAIVKLQLKERSKLFPSKLRVSQQLLLIGILLMPLPLAAQVFLLSIYTQGKKSQCAAKGKGISNILVSCPSQRMLARKKFCSHCSKSWFSEQFLINSKRSLLTSLAPSRESFGAAYAGPWWCERAWFALIKFYARASANLE